MQYIPADYTGPLEILDGHPVPYSGTCQRKRLDNGQMESVDALNFTFEITEWLTRHRPGNKLLRTDGAYFFYGAAEQAITIGEDSVTIEATNLDAIAWPFASQ